MKNILLLPLFLVTITSLILSACQPTGTASSQDEPAATPETAGDLSEPEVLLDPTLLPVSDAYAYVYEGLVQVDGDEIAPLLALESTVSDDGLEYILTLRPGVRFHDGTAFNADAVIANFNRWFDPQDELRGSGSYDAWEQNFGGFKSEVTDDGKPKSNFDGIEKVDELTVLIHLNNPDPDFLYKLSNPAFAIISPAALASSGQDGGTGPYRFGAFGAESIKLEPYSDYWNLDAIPAGSIEVTP